MIDRDGLLFLNDYERWATTRILDAPTELPALLRDAGYRS